MKKKFPHILLHVESKNYLHDGIYLKPFMYNPFVFGNMYSKNLFFSIQMTVSCNHAIWKDDYNVAIVLILNIYISNKIKTEHVFYYCIFSA